MSLIEQIKAAGIVGAGGAGFPTHIKVKTKADVVIANGAECEPLLRVDQLVMEKYANEIVDAVSDLVVLMGAAKGVICTKKHYHKAIDALKEALQDKSNIEIKLFDSFYPAGDEQAMVYEVTGKVVPTGGLPLDVGAVVVNVSTLKNIHFAKQGTPVTDKLVTVVGEVDNPITVKAPVGTSYQRLIDLANGPSDLSEYSLVIGGPCMGKLTKDVDDVVTKTTGGIIVLKDNHMVVDQKRHDPSRDLKLAKAVCCQCSLCTQICPRNALGLNVKPHLAMRAAANGDGNLLGDINGVFSCCDCGLCTIYACNFGLNPAKMMARYKDRLRADGIKPKKERYEKPSSFYNLIKVPVSRLTGRLNVKKYEVDTPLIDSDMSVDVVNIPLSQHIGVPSVPCVSVGQVVQKGDIIATNPDGSLGAHVHASIGGKVRSVKDGRITVSSVEA